VEDEGPAIRFKDDEDRYIPPRQPTPPPQEPDEFDLAIEPDPPSPAKSQSSVAGRSRAGQTRAGETRAGQSQAGKSRAGQSRAGQSRAGRSGFGKSELTELGDDSERVPPDLGQLLDIKEPPAARESDGDLDFSIPRFPSMIADVLLPWILSIGGLGLAGYILFQHIQPLPGKPVGFSMLAAGYVLYVALLVPLTLRSVHSAAVAAKYRLPNAVWFQTFGLLALPTLGLVMGFDAGGGSSMIVLGLLGLLLMGLLMLFMFPGELGAVGQTVAYAVWGYITSSALCAAILAGAGLILWKAGITVPWAQETTVVAAQTTQPSQTVSQSTAPLVVQATTTPAGASPSATQPVQAPVVVQAPPQVPVQVAVPAGPPWMMPVEPINAAAAWRRAEAEYHTTIEVGTPCTILHAGDGGPYAAVLEPAVTVIYDLRTGQHVGAIKAAFQTQNFLLSSDGTTVAGVETEQPGAMFTDPNRPAGTIEIWSVGSGQMSGQVPGNATLAVPTPLAFAGGRLIASGASMAGSGLQAWDCASGTLQHQWKTSPLTREELAVSHSGNFVAAWMGDSIRLFNLNTGDIAGELTVPQSPPPPNGLAFSPDGRTLAAVFPADLAASINGTTSDAVATVPQETVVEWDLSNHGKLLRAVPIDLSATAPPNLIGLVTNVMPPSDRAKLQWTPSGGALRVEDGLFDAVTGKTICTLPIQRSGNLAGRLVAAGERRSTYEFLPAGLGTHVMIKTFDLTPTAQSALTTLARSSAAASTLGATSQGANSTSAMIMATTAPVPEAPVTVTPDQIAALGAWDVTVKSISKADPTFLRQQLTAANQAVTQVQTDLQNSAQQAGAPGQVLALQQRLDQLQQKAKKLQDLFDNAPSVRRLLVILDGGTAAHVTTDSATSAAFADFLHLGDHVHITGSGWLDGDNVNITMQTAAPLAKN
jgi:hypothetical protein